MADALEVAVVIGLADAVERIIYKQLPWRGAIRPRIVVRRRLAWCIAVELYRAQSGRTVERPT